MAKAGIVCSLSARATVLAAANPAGGHYDRSKTIMENLRLSAPVLSRFDLVFIMLDDPDEEKDRQLSRHIIDIHTGRHSALEGGGRGEGGGRSSSRGREPAGTLREQASAQRGKQMEALERRATAERARRRAIASSVARAEDRASRTQASQAASGGSGSSAAAAMLMGEEGGESFETRLRRRVLGIDDPLPSPLLRKYVAFARRHCHPVLTPAAAAVLQECYIGLR